MGGWGTGATAISIAHTQQHVALEIRAGRNLFLPHYNDLA